MAKKIQMTKTVVKSVLKISRDAQLARLVGLERCSVYFWGTTKPIPRLRRLLLHRQFPRKFPESRYQID